MNIRDLSRDDLVALAQQTYEKSEWSREDIGTLRGALFKSSSGAVARMPSCSSAGVGACLNSIKIEPGEVDEDYVLMCRAHRG